MHLYSHLYQESIRSVLPRSREPYASKNKIFPRNFSPRLKFLAPSQARSGNAFGFALFEGRGRLGSSKFKPFYTLSDSKNSDPRLRFFKMCPRYDKEVLESPETYSEADKYLSLHAPRVSQRISRLLNISSELLTASRLLSMWKACLFEFSLSGNANHWCSVFNQEEFEMFEFHADLKRYYESGYGAPAEISTEIACELMKDIITLMDARVDHDHKILLEHASLRFAHAEVRKPVFLEKFGFFPISHPSLISFLRSRSLFCRRSSHFRHF
jgi:hypothetical protein